MAQRKDAKTQKKTDSKAAQLQYGATIVGLLKDQAHVKKLVVAQLHAALTFKAVAIPKGAKKPDLLRLIQSVLALPSAEKPPPMPELRYTYT